MKTTIFNITMIMLAVVLVACEKDNPQPKWTPLPPLELDDELYYYVENGKKEYFERYRIDRAAIKLSSYDQARELSGRLTPSFFMGEWVFAHIDPVEMDLTDLLALPGALDATYGLEYRNGVIQYPMNDIFIEVKPGLTPQKVLEKVGLFEYVSSIEPVGGHDDTYHITFNLSAREMLRICRKLYEAEQCVFANPDFFIVTK